MPESKSKKINNKIEESVMQEFLKITLSFAGRFLNSERESEQQENRKRLTVQQR